MSEANHSGPANWEGDGEARPDGGGTGRDVEADRFESLFECLGWIGDAGVKARGFLETARLLLRDNAPSVPRRGEVVTYCVRQAADSILESAGTLPGDRRWRDLSRRVVSAKKGYERAKRFAEDGLEAALAELLAEIDALDEFHQEEPTRRERQAAAVHARLTGSRTAGGGLGPIRDFLGVRDEAASRLHGTCSVDDAGRLLSECVDAMLGFLLSTADKRDDLAELARRVSPGNVELEASRRLIVDDSDIEAFLGLVTDPGWLDLLYQDGHLDLPLSPGGWWAARTAAIRLSGSHRQQVTAWLLGVASQDWSDPARCAAVADVLLSMDGPELEAALEIATRHPRDSNILWHFTLALEGIDPSDLMVERCADTFLNALVAESQSRGQPVDLGWDRLSGDMTALLRMLSDGANEQNARSRIRLLLLKMGKMPSRYWAFDLFPMGRDPGLPISSLADADPDEYDGEQVYAIGGFVVSILARAMGWLPAAELLELAEEAPEALASRFRTWILAAAPDADPDAMAVEIEEAIGSRLPNCDDIVLIDRIALEFGTDGLTDRYRAALGDPPSVAEASQALASGELLPDWRFPYLWSGLLPEAAVAAWADAPATHILAAQIGPPETKDYYLRLSYDPDSDIRPGWVQPPFSAEHLRSLGPERATDEIAAWHPQPHGRGHSYRLLARTLNQVVGEGPAVWLAEPLRIAVRLHDPTYISSYLQGAAQAAAEKPDAFETVPVGGLVDVITMAQREPWPAERLDGNSRSHVDHDADWLPARRAGTDLIKALLDSGIGLAGRDDDVWHYLETEVRTNPDVFEADMVDLGFADDPVLYMLDNAEGDNTPSDPFFLAINQASTRAVDTALSFMAAEYRTTEAVRPQAADLLEWCLHLTGLEGAKNRAVIAPRAALLSRILPEWFDQNHSLLFGGDAPGRLGQLSVDMAVKFSQPWEWLLVNHRDSIYNSAVRSVNRSLDWLQIAMLHGFDGYDPPKLAQRLEGRLPQACGALAKVIDRIDQPTPEQIGVLHDFCDLVIEQGGGQYAAALGQMAYADNLDHDTWTAITLEALDATGGYIDQAHQITKRILGNPPTPRNAAILIHLVEVQTNGALVRTTDETGQNQPAYFHGAWPRRLIADQAADWLDAAQNRDTADEYVRLEETLRRHRLLRRGGPE